MIKLQVKTHQQLKSVLIIRACLVILNKLLTVAAPGLQLVQVPLSHVQANLRERVKGACCDK